MNLNTDILKRGDKLTVTRDIADKYWTVPAGVTAVVDRIDYYEGRVSPTRFRYRVITLKLSEVIPRLPHPTDETSERDGCDLLCIDTSDDLAGAEMLDCLALLVPVVAYRVEYGQPGYLPTDVAYVETRADVVDILDDHADVAEGDPLDSESHLSRLLKFSDDINPHVGNIDIPADGLSIAVDDWRTVIVEPLTAYALLDAYNTANEGAQENRTYETASTLHDMAVMFEDAEDEVAAILSALDGTPADSDRIYSVETHIGGYRVYGEDWWENLAELYADEREREFWLETLNGA
jgi:hypothetical protein